MIGKVSLITSLNDGFTSVWVDGVPNNKPACATIAHLMIKDENSEAGKKQFSLLVAAYASGRTVRIEGDSVCTRWGDGEDIQWVNLMPN